MKKLYTMLTLGAMLTVSCGNSSKGNGGSEEPSITENQPAANIPDHVESDGILGEWKPDLSTLQLMMNSIAKVDYSMYILEDRVIARQKCLDNGLEASIESKIEITDTHIETLEDQNHEVKSLKSNESCSIGAVKGKNKYYLSKDKNTLTIQLSFWNKQVFHRVK